MPSAVVPFLWSRSACGRCADYNTQALAGRGHSVCTLQLQQVMSVVCSWHAHTASPDWPHIHWVHLLYTDRHSKTCGEARRLKSFNGHVPLGHCCLPGSARQRQPKNIVFKHRWLFSSKQSEHHFVFGMLFFRLICDYRGKWRHPSHKVELWHTISATPCVWRWPLICSSVWEFNSASAYSRSCGRRQCETQMCLFPSQWCFWSEHEPQLHAKGRIHATSATLTSGTWNVLFNCKSRQERITVSRQVGLKRLTDKLVSHKVLKFYFRLKF